MTKTMEVSFPLSPPPGYVSRHVQVRFDPEHALMFAEIHNGLKETGAQLSDGKEVDKLADTVRYLVEVAHRHGAEVARQQGGRADD